ncbi:uncharacterized protein [Aegilops tauschii subsp. strangulata]|uniref:uncharacterized protein n=1 Tax=Aegilops tauschii subsp. strangulata TaxID=200361 RepID=UPI000989B7B7|nr:uncharacterized protein LOC109738333 [Aegilops tauschii subsp. strangulata]XP_044356737.1 uncharacterized protein LOC123078333 isoform X3 [Triticum aestivum]
MAKMTRYDDDKDNEAACSSSFEEQMTCPTPADPSGEDGKRARWMGRWTRRRLRPSQPVRALTNRLTAVLPLQAGKEMRRSRSPPTTTRLCNHHICTPSGITKACQTD